MSDFKDTLRRVIVPIHPEGYKIIAMAAGVTLLLSMLSSFFAFLGFIIIVFCVYFFRDPNRIVPDGDNIIVAPADGVVDVIAEAAPPEELGFDSKEKFTRISIFLSIFNVHIQRIPVAGKITKLHYREGKFLNVAMDKYSPENERQSCALRTKNGTDIAFVQIAGLIARRIFCSLVLNQEVKTGDRYGLIRFGSRVDLYIPSKVKVNVKVGQTMIGGETVIAQLGSSMKASGSTTPSRSGGSNKPLVKSTKTSNQKTTK